MANKRISTDLFDALLPFGIIAGLCLIVAVIGLCGALYQGIMEGLTFLGVWGK